MDHSPRLNPKIHKNPALKQIRIAYKVGPYHLYKQCEITPLYRWWGSITHWDLSQAIRELRRAEGLVVLQKKHNLYINSTFNFLNNCPSYVNRFCFHFYILCWFLCLRGCFLFCFVSFGFECRYFFGRTWVQTPLQLSPKLPSPDGFVLSLEIPGNMNVLEFQIKCQPPKNQ